MNPACSPIAIRANRIEELLATRDMTVTQIMDAMGMTSRSMVNASMRVLRGINPKIPSKKRVFIPYWLPPDKQGQWIAVWRAGSADDAPQPNMADRKLDPKRDLPLDYGRPKAPPVLPIAYTCPVPRPRPRTQQVMPPPRDSLTSALFGAAHKKPSQP